VKSPSNTVIYTVLASLRLYDQVLCRGIVLCYQTYSKVILCRKGKNSSFELRAEQFEYLNYTQDKNYIVLYNMRTYNYFTFITVIHQAHYKYYKELSFPVVL
jgi:hypothetical protein